jgi:N-acetylmuramoyl-L-alanine amidase
MRNGGRCGKDIVYLQKILKNCHNKADKYKENSMRKFIYISFIFFLPAFLHNNWQIEAQNRKPIVSIIIDPAHGGMDLGGIGNHTINGKNITFLEKDITLEIAQVLKEYLIKTFPDFNIALTRNDDTFIPLDERLIHTRENYLYSDETTLFISIHINASSNPNNRGYEFIIQNNFNINSGNLKFAEKVSSEFNKVFEKELPFLGINEGDWYILRNAPGTSIMTEIGYITNFEDTLLLYSKQGVEKCATALTNGIVAYINSL